MAKREAKVIHPVTMLESLEAYKNDCNGLQAAVCNLLMFAGSDRKENYAATLEVALPQLQKAYNRVARWNAQVDDAE